MPKINCTTKKNTEIAVGVTRLGIEVYKTNKTIT